MTAKKNKILLVTQDKPLSAAVIAELRPLRGVTVLECRENVMDKVFDEVPHLIVVDESFHEGQGRKIAHLLKEDMVLRYIPIVLLAEDSHLVMSRESEKIDSYVPKNKIDRNLTAQVRAVLDKNHNELDLNPLTSLPGARSSVLRIERAIRLKTPFAVCCIDLTNLAAFNRAYGDVRGDEIIIRLSQIARDALKYHASPGDFLGHLGGDDLLVVTRSDLAEDVSRTIIQSFDAVIPSFYDPEVRDQGYFAERAGLGGALTQYPIMSVSIAVVQNEDHPRYEMPEISKIAGELKRYMKSLPGSCYIHYRRKKTAKKNKEENSTLELHFPSKKKSVTLVESHGDPGRPAAFFHDILKSKSIRTVYQPMLDLNTRRVVGYEALTRPLSNYPSEDATFLFSAAREAGLVKELDVLCVQCALKSGQALGGEQKLFLNLNHETLLDPKRMDRLFDNKGSIGYKNIVIEVTEQSSLRSFDKVREALLELKEQGVSVAIDDMGGGAVSLRDVAVLKPDYIKFDRSLIRQIDASTTKQQIVLSMILFAQGIHAMTTAEGIETREEYETARMCGVNLGQGYFFAKPGPAFPEVSL